MNREQIAQLASTAGWRVDYFTNNSGRRLVGLTPANLEQVLRFAALVAAHEREQCALVCEQWNASHPERLAAAIRSRKDAP